MPAPGCFDFRPGARGAGPCASIFVCRRYWNRHESVTSTLFIGLLPLALLLPVHRSECLLGFVLGMSVAFGAVLPTLFGSIMALATFVVHRLIGLPLQRLAWLRSSGSR